MRVVLLHKINHVRDQRKSGFNECIPAINVNLSLLRMKKHGLDRVLVAILATITLSNPCKPIEQRAAWLQYHVFIVVINKLIYFTKVTRNLYIDVNIFVTISKSSI